MIVAVPGARLGVVVAPEVVIGMPEKAAFVQKNPRQKPWRYPQWTPSRSPTASEPGRTRRRRRAGWTAPGRLSALLRAKFAACSDQSDRGPVSNVLHELAIGGTAGPAACRSTPL